MTAPGTAVRRTDARSSAAAAGRVPRSMRSATSMAGTICLASCSPGSRTDSAGASPGEAHHRLPWRPHRSRPVFGTRSSSGCGPTSRQRTRLVFLAGNHEEVLLRILGGEVQLVPDWLRFGGAECLRSYGTDPDRLRKMAPARALEAIRSAFPARPCRIPARLRRHLPRRRLSVRPRRHPAGHPFCRAGASPTCAGSASLS